MGTEYRIDATRPQWLVRGIAQTIELAVYDEAGALVAPSAGTVTVVRPDGTKLVDAQSVTVSGSIATYSVTPASTETQLGEGWAVQWDLTLDSVAQPTIVQPGALAIRRLLPSVTNAHLLERHPELTSYPDGQSSWDAQISSAWDVVLDECLRAGKPPYRILNPEGLHQPLLAASLAIVFRLLSTYSGDGSGRYSELAEHYDLKARDGWQDAILTVDLDDDGHPDEDEQGEAAEPVLYTSMPPGWGGDYGDGWL